MKGKKMTQVEFMAIMATDNDLITAEDKLNAVVKRSTIKFLQTMAFVSEYGHITVRDHARKTVSLEIKAIPTEHLEPVLDYLAEQYVVKNKSKEELLCEKVESLMYKRLSELAYIF